MKKSVVLRSAFSARRVLALFLCSASLFLGLLGLNALLGTTVVAQGTGQASSIQVGASYHNDVSRPLRDVPAWSDDDFRRAEEREANENPKIPYRHRDSSDPVVQNWHVSEHGFTAPNIPTPIRTFD